jgi:two-component system cell cycle sensor histidine kinase/response regulator CckA
MGEDVTQNPTAADNSPTGELHPPEQAARSEQPDPLTRRPRQWGADEFPDRGRGWGAERNLKIQRAYLEQLFDSAPEGIVILDTQSRVQHANPEFTRMFGWEADEVRGRKLYELVVPEDRRREVDWVLESVSKGHKVSLEGKRRRKDGTLLDVSIQSMPVSVDGGQIAIYAIYRDISERKQSEALQSALYRIAEKTSSAEDLQEFYSSIHAIVAELMYARNFYIALHDPGTLTISFPYFVDEEESPPGQGPLGRGLTEYVLQTGEPLLASPELFENLVRQGKVESVGAPSVDWLGVPLKTGARTFGVLVVQSYSQRVRFGAKEKDILTFVSQQVASAIQHKRHQEELRQSEARYRSLVQSAVYGMYRSSLEGRFLDVNPALITMLGYASAEEVLALDPECDLYVDGSDRARLVREYERSGRIDNVEVRWKRKDGKAITVRLSGRAVRLDQTEALEIIAEDVSERRVLEEQFRQAQKMEAVGRLAGGVAHDFNNLLMVISGYTEVLLNQLGPGDPRRKKAEAIQRATDRASTLTRQLLAFGRKQMLELKVIDLNAVVSDITKLLRPLIGEDIELLLRPASDLGKTKADPGQIEQVIMNLAVNARDAMPDGGTLIIETSNADLDDAYRRAHASLQPGAYVMLAVSDTGCGMDQETQSRIFEPFFTTKDKGKGTGLGLSTVYGIVKQSGGYVFAYSEPGRGTSFKVYLPRVNEDAPQEAATESSRKTRHQGCETVLLVEDEESVRELIREALEARGYNVCSARNGNEALAIATRQELQIDLMITDVVMPGMGGRELATRIATIRPRTRILYLSGYTEDAIVHHGVLELGTAFLQKPFTLDALASKVREVLEASTPS